MAAHAGGMLRAARLRQPAAELARCGTWRVPPPVNLPHFDVARRRGQRRPRACRPPRRARAPRAGPTAWPRESVRAVDVDGADDGGRQTTARPGRAASTPARSAATPPARARATCAACARAARAVAPRPRRCPPSRRRCRGVTAGRPRASTSRRSRRRRVRRLGEEREHELVDLAVVGERRGHRDDESRRAAHWPVRATCRRRAASADRHA